MFSRNSLRKCWTLAWFSEASKLFQAGTALRWVSFLPAVARCEESRGSVILKLQNKVRFKMTCAFILWHGHTAAVCGLGKACAENNELFVGRVDVQGWCAVPAAHYLAFVRLSRRSRRHGNAKQWAPLKRLGSLSSPSLSLPLLSSQAISPLSSAAVRRGRATGWHDSGNQFTACFISF